MKKKIKAIGMVSGGLDSSIASAMMIEQGIEILGLNFSTGFCKSDHHRQINHPHNKEKRLINESLRLGADLEFPVKIIDISKEYMNIILHPKYGYGKHINPCIDCRIFMLRKAKTIMEETGAEFVFTGEVLGQRPKSQKEHPLKIVTEGSGLGDRLLRPLSAKLLLPTYPEKMGLVKREKLEDISGRSRKRQIELAKRYNINDYPQPAGGCCFLTEEAFSRRFQDILKNPLPDLPPVPETMVLLKVGRHFRISSRAKCIIGHDAYENAFLESIAGDRITLRANMVATPVTVFLGYPDDLNLEIAARLTARYSDGRNKDAVDLTISYPDGVLKRITVKPMTDVAAKEYMI